MNNRKNLFSLYLDLITSMPKLTLALVKGIQKVKHLPFDCFSQSKKHNDFNFKIYQ